ncbi:MAG: GNAT family N-acetyltransferase [Proteobacteria bacterium]|nr:GNAT family N-acetyltransferase [Pseudomonadota bacterium]
MVSQRAICEFRTHDVLIRPWQSGDADALYDAASQSVATVGKWLPWCHGGYSRADSEAWIAHCRTTWDAGEQYAFAIFDENATRVLGGVGLNQIDRAGGTANLGYWVRSDAQGRGIATQAARLIGAFGFEHGFAKLEIVAALDNRASRRVAEKSGARLVRIERGRIEFRGDKLDAAIYVLSPPEQNAA